MWGWIFFPPCVWTSTFSLWFSASVSVYSVRSLCSTICMRSNTSRLDSYCNHHSLLKRSALKLHSLVPLPSLSMCSARFPGLHASAFDPSQPGLVLQHGSPCESRGPGLSTGSAGKKPGPQREVRKEKLKSWLLGERRQTAYQRAYQAMVGYMDSRASEDWHLN